jgi:hypothetical protein
LSAESIRIESKGKVLIGKKRDNTMEMKRIRELSKDIAKKTLYTTAAVTIMGVGMYQFQSKVSRNLKTQ